MTRGGKLLFVLAERVRASCQDAHHFMAYCGGFAVAGQAGGTGRYVGSKVGRARASAKCGMTAGSGEGSGQVPSPGSASPGRTGPVQGGGGGSGAVPATGGGASSLGAASQRRLASVDPAVPPQRASSGVLADRIAAALVHREPGWRLPRRSALARRYGVAIAEIDVAIAELSRRSLIRRLPDGQLYRASAAEYLIPVEGVGGLSTRLDPMGGEIACQSRHVSQRGAPQDVAWALGVEGEAPLRIIRCVWAVDAEPVAISTAYVPEAVANSLTGEDQDFFEAMLHSIPALSPARRRTDGRQRHRPPARGRRDAAARREPRRRVPGGLDRPEGPRRHRRQHRRATRARRSGWSASPGAASRRRVGRSCSCPSRPAGR